MSAGVGSQDNGMSWRKKGWRRSLCSDGNGVTEERETTGYRGGHKTGRIGHGEAEVEVWLCHQPTCHPDRRGLD